MRDHLHDPGEHQLLDRVDVAGDARHQVAELTALEEPERHPVQVGEQAGAQAQHEPLPEPGAQVVVDERQQAPDHRDADVGRRDQREEREVAGGEHVVDEDLEDPDTAASIAGPTATNSRQIARRTAERLWSAARSGAKTWRTDSAGAAVDQGGARLRVQRGAGGASAGRPVSGGSQTAAHDGGGGLSRRSSERGGPTREREWGHRCRAQLSQSFLPCSRPLPRDLWPRLLFQDGCASGRGRSRPGRGPEWRPGRGAAGARVAAGAAGQRAEHAVENCHGGAPSFHLVVYGRAPRDRYKEQAVRGCGCGSVAT